MLTYWSRTGVVCPAHLSSARIRVSDRYCHQFIKAPGEAQPKTAKPLTITRGILNERERSDIGHSVCLNTPCVLNSYQAACQKRDLCAAKLLTSDTHDEVLV